MAHICEDTESGVSREFFERLVIKCISVVRRIEHILFFEYAVMVGASKEQAERLVNYEFGDNFMSEWKHLMEEIDQYNS